MVVDRYWPAPGGVETLLHHVATALADEGHEVAVHAISVDAGASTRLSNGLTAPAPFRPIVDGGVRVEPVRLDRRTKAALLPTAVQVVPGLRRFAFGAPRLGLLALYGRVVASSLRRAADEADVVHAWSADMLGTAALIAARRRGRPFVLTPFVHPGQWGGDAVSARLYRRADRVIGLLEVERQVLAQTGVDPSKIRICGSCSPGVRTGGGPALRQQHGIFGPLVVFLGVRRPYKGHDILLDACARMHRSATVAFVGPGDPLPPRTTPGDTPVSVIDVGPVDEDARAAWLDAADVLCLPSSHEIFPITVLEAWSAHTPVLVSTIPPLVELIERSGGGRTVLREPAALAAALDDIIGDEAGRVKLGRRGNTFWREHATPVAAARRHAEIYRELF
jgi:phosphatidyl-myo-inositol dimannoside synthase